MRNIAQGMKKLEIALVFGVLIVTFLAVRASEAQPIFLPNLDVVLLDCVEDANAFVVQNVSSTRDVDIQQGLSCVEAVQKLFATGFELKSGAGGVTLVAPAALNHFMMLFVLDMDAFIEPTLKKEPVPLVPLPKIHKPLSPIIQRR